MHPFGTSAERSKGCNFIAPQALIQQLYYYYFILLGTYNYRAIFDTSAERSEAHVLKGYIKNCFIVKLYNKVLIITNVLSKLLHNDLIISTPQASMEPREFENFSKTIDFSNFFSKLHFSLNFKEQCVLPSLLISVELSSYNKTLEELQSNHAKIVFRHYSYFTPSLRPGE